MMMWTLRTVLLSIPLAIQAFTSTKYNPTKKKSTCVLLSSRRKFIERITIGTAVGSFVLPQQSSAGEVGAKINKVVTQSDLGISVRRSVVKGAQLIDNLDSKWEKFSDDNGLGAARFNQQPRPTPKDIPDLTPLNYQVAKSVLLKSDEALLETLVASGINNIDLASQVKKVDDLVRKSFERSGLDLNQSEMTATEFNFYCYTHFKGFCDIIIENKLSFNKLKFENKIGEKLLPIFAPSAKELIASIPKQQSKESQAKAIDASLKIIDEIMGNLVSFGFCALAERNAIETEEGRISDWIEDYSNIQLSISLDDDITIKSQLLLQEQGFRIVPSFGRFMINEALQLCFDGMKQSINTDEYYMDTGYSSDPNLFEVKQVLINVVIDGA